MTLAESSLNIHSVPEAIDAGSFGAWLIEVREALRTNRGMNVPCGDCVGCCVSGYSILLRPHDAALDIIPAALLSSVTGLAYPHAKMNPRDNGHCPMLENGKCGIYKSRPQTCIDYDCRVFTAAGIDAGPRPIINQRIRAWRFSYASNAEQQTHQAIKSAASFIERHVELFPSHWNVSSPAAVAVLAIKVYELFLDNSIESVSIEDMADKIIHCALAFSAPTDNLPD
jgi:Fe-S-cluster containining protein